jgi:hypothetical protein
MGGCSRRSFPVWWCLSGDSPIANFYFSFGSRFNSCGLVNSRHREASVDKRALCDIYAHRPVEFPTTFVFSRLCSEFDVPVRPVWVSRHVPTLMYRDIDVKTHL